MKSLLVVLALCFFAFQNANASNCLYSASFSAEVTHVVDDGQGCWAYLDLNYYMPSFYCPLERSAVEYYGVYSIGKDCPFHLGQNLSGELARYTEDQIRLVD
jgi:hypothetical protein